MHIELPKAARAGLEPGERIAALASVHVVNCRLRVRVSVGAGNDRWKHDLPLFHTNVVMDLALGTNTKNHPGIPGCPAAFISM